MPSWAPLSPRGGRLRYLREAYGPLFGFLAGWSSFFVTFSGSVASLAVGFAEYMAFFFPFLRDDPLLSLGWAGFSMQLSSASILSIVVILLLSGIQVVGVRQGSRVQNLLTLLKIVCLLAIIVLAVTLGRGKSTYFYPFFTWREILHPGSLGLAFIPVIFTYAGWNAVIYMAGEVRNPARNLPRSLLWGNVLIIALYLSINVVYLYGVPVSEMRGMVRVAEVATTALFGYGTSAWITGIIAISILGALNAMIMTGPRIYYAMAEDGLFFHRMARIHPRYRTPSAAIFLQACWSCVLVLSGTFDALLTYVAVIIVVFSALTVAALIVLRFKRPDLTRPYRVWGYPTVPSLFVLAFLALALSILRERPWSPLWVSALWLWESPLTSCGKSGKR